MLGVSEIHSSKTRATNAHVEALMGQIPLTVHDLKGHVLVWRPRTEAEHDLGEAIRTHVRICFCSCSLGLRLSA